MKHISKFMLLPLLALPLMFTSCDQDDDDNPTLDLSHLSEGFVLNVPANAANNTYDLAAASSMELTCSSPNYGGVPYGVRYYVQVAIDPAFANDSTVAHTELSTSYNSAKMDVDAAEINTAVVDLFKANHPDEDYPNSPRPLYVRLRAVLDGQGSLGQTYSNVITLPSVLATYVAPPATYPDNLLVIGSNVGTAWSTWQKVTPVYGVAGEYYTIVYVPANGQLKWGTFENDWRGYNRLTSITDNAGAKITESGDGNSNMIFGNAGWYVLHFVCTLNGSSATYALTVEPGKVYVIGNGTGDWTDGNAAWECKAPADQTGFWESPAFTASGELRAYIKVPGLDWWRTEFTLYKGTTVYFRDFDIPDSWAQGASEKAKPAKSDPENYSITVQPGQKMYVSFDSGTGYIK